MGSSVLLGAYLIADDLTEGAALGHAYEALPLVTALLGYMFGTNQLRGGRSESDD